MTRYESRVTVDIDAYGDWRLRALRAYTELRRLASRVEVRISASGRGLHLIGWTTDEVSLEARLHLRRTFSDDSNRVRMDSIRGAVGHTTGVCWTEKDGEEADLDFATLDDALTHIEASEPWAQTFKTKVQTGLVR